MTRSGKVATGLLGVAFVGAAVLFARTRLAADESVETPPSPDAASDVSAEPAAYGAGGAAFPEPAANGAITVYGDVPPEMTMSGVMDAGAGYGAVVTGSASGRVAGGSVSAAASGDAEASQGNPATKADVHFVYQEDGEATFILDQGTAAYGEQ